MSVALLVAASATPLDPAALTHAERARFAALPGGWRRRQWLTGRRALRRCAAGSAVVSVSHATGMSVACAPIGARVLGVGIDIELDRVPDPRTGRFFLTGPELAWLASVPEAARPREQLRLWTVKEALFKADPDNDGRALRDYAVADPARYRGRSGTGFRYRSVALPRGFLTVAVALDPERTLNTVQNNDFDQMVKRISELVSVPVQRLTPDVTIGELVPDSFLFVEVAVDLQEEFDVVLSQQDLKQVHTLGDLATLLASRRDG